MKKSTYYNKSLFLLRGDEKKLPKMILFFLTVAIIDLLGLGLVGNYISLLTNPLALDGDIGTIVSWLGLPLELEYLLIAFGITLLLIFAIKTIVTIWINYVIINFSMSQQTRLRTFLMHAYQMMPYSEYLNRNSSEYIYSIQTLTQQFSQGVVLTGVRMLSDIIVGIAILAFLAWTDFFAFTLLLTLILLLILSYDKVLKRKVHDYGVEANLSAEQMIQGVNEGIGGLKELRILGNQDHFYQKVCNDADSYAKYQGLSMIYSSAPRYLIELVLMVFVIVFILISSQLQNNLQYIAPTLGIFGVAALRLMPSVSSISSGLVQFRYNRDAVSILYDDVLLMQDYKEDRVPNPVDIQRLKSTEFKSISLNNINYKYMGGSSNIIENLSLVINNGDSVGFIGSSGSGKTTLIDILLGLLEPQSGEILFNGKSLNSPHVLAAWRNQVAYLPQQVFLTDDTLKNNIALGQADNCINKEQLQDALQKAKLISLVEKLPNGIDTVLGENGMRLSGGQRQRIALARAFYYGKNVLIMDESTSALDNEIEREIVEEIKQLKHKKTLIVIAHRLSTLEHCDVVYKLNDKTVCKVDINQQ